jgi:hypothetical protein
MPDLKALLQHCEDDTSAVLGHIAAHRLGNWKRHTASQDSLVLYIRKLLWGEHCANGRVLDQQGRLSLERIVLDHCPDLFSDSDREQAKRTLGISK